MQSCAFGFAVIIVPIFDESNEIFAILDIDSEHLATFDQCDKEWLEKITTLIKK
ncbi:MAG: hypothetical protein IKM65_01580 [Bacteroidaceae bacterium]|nr:hypothetical protein [Bacteroidaceae bacterium]